MPGVMESFLWKNSSSVWRTSQIWLIVKIVHPRTVPYPALATHLVVPDNNAHSEWISNNVILSTSTVGGTSSLFCMADSPVKYSPFHVSFKYIKSFKKAIYTGCFYNRFLVAGITLLITSRRSLVVFKLRQTSQSRLLTVLVRSKHDNVARVQERSWPCSFLTA